MPRAMRESICSNIQQPEFCFARVVTKLLTVLPYSCLPARLEQHFTHLRRPLAEREHPETLAKHMTRAAGGCALNSFRALSAGAKERDARRRAWKS